MNLTSFSSEIGGNELNLRYEHEVAGHPSKSHQIVNAIEQKLAESVSQIIPPRFSVFTLFYSLWNPYFLANSIIHSKILFVELLDQFWN